MYQKRGKEDHVPLHLLLDFDFALLQYEILSNDSLPDILDIFNDRFEVRRSIIRIRNEDIVR